PHCGTTTGICPIELAGPVYSTLVLYTGPVTAFAEIPTTTLADVLGRGQVMDLPVRPLWSSGRLAGPAFTVRCPPGDNLMLHAAIHRAEPGAVIVVESGDVDYALAGGNVCAVAQRRGITAFVLDGLIRDAPRFARSGFRFLP